jgi:tetratricopeptide (TPR) repeat protein
MSCWKAAFVVALSVLLLFAPLADGQTSDNPNVAQMAQSYGLKYREIHRAILTFKSGKHDIARQILLDARAKHPELPPVDVMMARLYFSINKTEQAESALERVVVEAPDDPEAFVLLGDLSLRAKRLAFAELAYSRANDLLTGYDAIPDRKRNLQIRVLGGLASLSENRRQYEQAAEYLRSWMELDAENPLPLGSLGRVSFLSENYDTARAAFTQLSEIAPKAPPAEIAMGRLYSDAGMHAEALNEMNLAVQKHPADLRALLTVAEWALNNGEMDMAQDNVTASLKLDPQSVPARVLSARLARSAGDVEKAESLLRDLVPLSPNSFIVTDEYARTLATSPDEKKRQAALEYAQQNFQEQQKRGSNVEPQAIVTYAWTLLQNGQHSKSEAVVQTLPDGSVISNENGYFVAAIYAGRGKKDVATSMLKALLANERFFPGRKAAEGLLAELSAE